MIPGSLLIVFDQYRMRTLDGRYEWIATTATIWVRSDLHSGWEMVPHEAKTQPEAERTIDAHMTATATAILTGAA